MVELQDLEVPEEAFENPLIGLHLKCMNSFGYLVSKQQEYKRFHLCRGAVFVASFAVFCSLMFIKVSKGNNKLSDDAISIAAAFTYLTFSIVTVNAYFQRKRVVHMVRFLHEDITALFRITDTEEGIMLAKTIKYLWVVKTAIGTPSFVAVIVVSGDCFYRTAFKPDTVFNIPEVLNGTAQPILLFRLFPFGEVYDNFLLAYLAPFYAMCLGAFTIPWWHIFIVCLMKYIALKYAILSKRLKEYDLSTDLNCEKLKCLTERDLLYCQTKMCEFIVREQIKLKWFTKELEALIRIPAFLGYVIFSVLICFQFYAIAAGDPSNMDYLFFAIYMFVITFTLWLYHWHATLITESNDKFCLALYNSPWYSFPINIQKNIRLMMMESTKPLIMKAIFFELNLKTFIDVIRGGYSYFSILRNSILEQDEGN